jgi:hypothetical protein
MKGQREIYSTVSEEEESEAEWKEKLVKKRTSE